MAATDPLDVTIPRHGIVPPYPAAGHDRLLAVGAIFRLFRRETGWAPPVVDVAEA